MRSTFMGLEASKRGLFVQQTALYTTGHNISNANTLGYSRQRVNMQATPGFPTAGLNSPSYPGHLGTGVEATSIQRIRDEFIDRQYRQETNKLGYWESRTKAISQMEDVLSEPSEFGINQAFNDFWKALEDVGANPEDTAARKVALSKAQALAEAFNYNDTQLKSIQQNLGNEINVSKNNINSLLKQIAAINKQIQEVEPNGYVPNDLYDARDVLVDQLNEYIPVTIERVPSGGLASDVAEGSLTIKFTPYPNGDPITLVSGKNYVEISITGNEADKDINGDSLSNVFKQINVSKLGEPPVKPIPNDPDSETISYDELEPSKGRFVSLIDSYGYEQTVAGVTTVKGLYPEMLAEFDKLVNSFAQLFNAMHAEGYQLDGKKAEEPDLFIGADPVTGKFSAASIKVNEKIIKSPSLLAASSGEGEEGNGKWAIELANLQKFNFDDSKAGTTQQFMNKNVDIPADIGLSGATFQSYYQGMVGQMAVNGQESIRLQTNSESLLLNVANNRASMSSVSLDEEMTNMITFQQAYNANARMITVVDETLDKIINGMGRVGL